MCKPTEGYIDAQLQERYAIFRQKSEFKKPYLEKGFPEMEYGKENPPDPDPEPWPPDPDPNPGPDPGPDPGPGPKPKPWPDPGPEPKPYPPIPPWPPFPDDEDKEKKKRKRGEDVGGCICGWDPLVCGGDDTDDTVDPGGTANLQISGGCGPYTWTVEGTGFSISQSEDWYKWETTLSADDDACGTATVTVEDACGDTCTFEIASTVGEWEYEESKASCPGCSFGYGCTTYPDYDNKTSRFQCSNWCYYCQEGSSCQGVGGCGCTPAQGCGEGQSLTCIFYATWTWVC